MLYKVTTEYQTTTIYDTTTLTSCSPKCVCCLPCVDENTLIYLSLYFRSIELVSKKLNVVAMKSICVNIFLILVCTSFNMHNIQKVPKAARRWLSLKLSCVLKIISRALTSFLWDGELFNIDTENYFSAVTNRTRSGRKHKPWRWYHCRYKSNAQWIPLHRVPRPRCSWKHHPSHTTRSPIAL